MPRGKIDLQKVLASLNKPCPHVFPHSVARGVTKGELSALKWGDIQFAERESDANRYILVQRNYSQGRFTSPKSKKSRRVDLSKQLRAALLELRDLRLLAAMMGGKTSIADDLLLLPYCRLGNESQIPQQGKIRRIPNGSFGDRLRFAHWSGIFRDVHDVQSAV